MLAGTPPPLRLGAAIKALMKKKTRCDADKVVSLQAAWRGYCVRQLRVHQHEQYMPRHVICRWQSLVSKTLAMSSGPADWGAVVRSVQLFGFVPISEEAVEVMMQHRVSRRFLSIQNDTRMGKATHLDSIGGDPEWPEALQTNRRDGPDTSPAASRDDAAEDQLQVVAQRSSRFPLTKQRSLPALKKSHSDLGRHRSPQGALRMMRLSETQLDERSLSPSRRILGTSPGSRSPISLSPLSTSPCQSPDRCRPSTTTFSSSQCQSPNACRPSRGLSAVHKFSLNPLATGGTSPSLSPASHTLNSPLTSPPRITLSRPQQISNPTAAVWPSSIGAASTGSLLHGLPTHAGMPRPATGSRMSF